MVGAVADANHMPRPSRPGPRPLFRRRMDLRLRDDQVRTLTRMARVLGVSASDLVRWFIDQGTESVEAVPTYETLKEAAGAE